MNLNLTSLEKRRIQLLIFTINAVYNFASSFSACGDTWRSFDCESILFVRSTVLKIEKLERYKSSEI